MTAARLLLVLGMLPLAALAYGCERPTSVHVESTDVTGTWAITASDIEGEGLTCSVAGLRVKLNQNADGTFTGQAVGGAVVTCLYFGTQTAQAIDSGVTVTGNVDVTARTIELDVPSEGATLNGSVSLTNETMGGTTSLVIQVGGGQNLTITGPWSGAQIF